MKYMTATEMQLRHKHYAARFERLRKEFAKAADEAMQPIIDRLMPLLERYAIDGEWSANRYGFHFTYCHRETYVFDWGHYCRATGREWSRVDRVLAWNPCNHIGHLRDF